MSFVNSARVAVQNLPADDPKGIVLRYLLAHGVGSHNGKPWRLIQAELEDHGIEMSQTQFQQTILRETRAGGDIFIGSNDHGRGRGYFLIQDRVDAEAMREFYEKRIAAEQANLDNLNALIANAQWNPA